MSTYKEVQKKSDKDLVAFINEKRQALRKFRFGSNDRNVRAVRTTKKEIARSLTALNAKKHTESDQVAK